MLTQPSGVYVHGTAMSESRAGAATKGCFMGVSLGLTLFPPPFLISILRGHNIFLLFSTGLMTN